MSQIVLPTNSASHMPSRERAILPFKRGSKVPIRSLATRRRHDLIILTSLFEKDYTLPSPQPRRDAALHRASQAGFSVISATQLTLFSAENAVEMHRQIR